MTLQAFAGCFSVSRDKLLASLFQSRTSRILASFAQEGRSLRSSAARDRFIAMGQDYVSLDQLALFTKPKLATLSSNVRPMDSR